MSRQPQVIDFQRAAAALRTPSLTLTLPCGPRAGEPSSLTIVPVRDTYRLTAATGLVTADDAMRIAEALWSSRPSGADNDLTTTADAGFTPQGDGNHATSLLALDGSGRRPGYLRTDGLIMELALGDVLLNRDEAWAFANILIFFAAFASLDPATWQEISEPRSKADLEADAAERDAEAAYRLDMASRQLA